MAGIRRRELLLGAGMIAAAPAAGLDPAEKQAMADLARAFMSNNDSPGLSIAIAKNDRLAYAEAFGTTGDGAERLKTEHRFRIASVSKPITSVTLMQLIEEGKLALGDRVFGARGVLGVHYGKPPYGPNIEAITIEHLMTHTAGGWSNEGPGPDPMFTHPRMDHAQLISWTLDNIPLRNAPGEHYAYSNFGYCVLGRVIEKLTGKGYAEHVRDKILRPCGITQMEIAGNTLEQRKPMEVIYHGQGGENPYNMQVARMDSHGGWIATPTDLVRLLVRVDGFDSKPDILSAATLRTMTTGSAADAGYAKGWMVNRQHNWWHNGSLPGSTTLMVRTSGGLCWAALSNTRKPASQIGLDLDRLIWNMVGKVTTWPDGDLFGS